MDLDVSLSIYLMIYAGVLILKGNRTYGYHGKRPLYRFRPHEETRTSSGVDAKPDSNTNQEDFLVPYELKLGFSKDIKNKYVLVRLVEEHTKGGYLLGIITETIGDVSDLSAFYEYRLYCRGIHDSISNFTKHTRQMTFAVPEPRPKPDTFVFSIDPAGCTDIDDAFSIRQTENGIQLCVHIANVALFLNMNNLWGFINERISTIYLPDKRRTMLPPLLSENLCSLLETTWRNVMTMELLITDDGIVGEPVFRAEEIYINKNYAYEEPRLLQNANYQTLLDTTRRISPSLSDSHDVVEYWMVHMNAKCGEHLAKRRMGIFRTAVITENADQQIIKDWNNAKCCYAVYNDDTNLEHQLLGKDAYAQTTSPIRRLVDTINQQLLLYETNEHIREWLCKIDTINERMKSIRKVQSECELITRLCNDTSLSEKTYEGVVFRVLEYGRVIVYISELGWFGKMLAKDEKEGNEVEVIVYIFRDEDDVRRKIVVSREPSSSPHPSLVSCKCS